MLQGKASRTVLRFVDLEVISNDKCISYEDYVPYIVDQHLCTSGIGIVGSCNEDSGGPLVVNGTQIAIVSFGVVNCSAGIPSVYVRLSYFADWIDEAMENFTRSDDYSNANPSREWSIYALLAAVLSTRL
ncbi:hypothetical protein HUJ04_000434 [Dendroctonus ponderosae]|nr:hypothetical protein HUJ04_000434 [Dendroctonus ponderosae]